MQCTVVVLNWNGREHLRNCLDSLRRQTFRDFLVLLADNGSTDGSPEWARREFPEIELLSLGSNLGFAAGNNRAIDRCATPWVALLNNDTEAEAAWLGSLMEAAARNPDASFFASQIRLFDRRDILDSAGDGLPTAGAAFKIGHLQPASRFGRARHVFGACAAAALYRTEMLRRLGGFDEDFFCIYEDADLNLRAQLAGYKCLYVPEAIVYHKVNATLSRRPDEAIFYGQRNAEWLIWKNIPATLLRRHILARIFYLAVSFLYFTVRGHGRTFLRAKWAAWRGREALLKKRRVIQRRQAVTDQYLDSLLERRWLRTRLAGKWGR